MTGMFLDGTGTEKCKCGKDCEFPCWQRLGIAGPCEMCGCVESEIDDQAISAHTPVSALVEETPDE